MKFSTVYIEKPWGGRTLEKFKGKLPDGLIGETWDISAQEQGISKITNGPLASQGLDKVVENSGAALLGRNVTTDFFPLMVRHVSSRENLSVQVHPTREYAIANGQHSGKDEAWYVLEAEPGAFVYAGVDPSTTEEEFRAAVLDQTVRDHLSKLPVSAGDCLFIPAGMVHAICAGVTLIEICENSNTTYRVYDYGRNRGLDIQETFDNMNLSYQTTVRRGLTRVEDGSSETTICLQPTMAMAVHDVSSEQQIETAGESFHALTCLRGNGRIVWSDDAPPVALERGESVLIPACIENYMVEGQLHFIRSWIPDPSVRERFLGHSIA